MAAHSVPSWPVVQGRRRSLVEQELLNSVGWLISLRWLAGAGVLVATAVATLALRVPVPAGRLYLVGALILGYNAVCWAVLRWMRRTRPEATAAFEALARAQIALDWLAMTVLVSSSGGAESPAIIFFLIHITIASLLLPHHHGFLYVSLAPVLVGVVALLEYFGLLPHVSIVQPARFREPLYVSAVLVFFTAACYVTAYSCMTIAKRLRRREAELGGLYDGVRDVTSTLDIAAVLDRIVEAAARVLTCKAAAIRLIDQTRAQVEFAASWGLSETYRDEVPGEYAKSVLDQDTLREGVVHVTDVENDPRIWHLRARARRAHRLDAQRGHQGAHRPLGVLRAYGAPGHIFAPRTSPTCRPWPRTGPSRSRTRKPTACWPTSTATSRSSCGSPPTSCARRSGSPRACC